MLQHKKTQGSALLTALFIMTLVAIVATAMSRRLQSDIYRTQLIVSHDKLYLASQAVTFWALDELNNKEHKFTKLYSQGMIDIYPKKLETIYNQVKISGGLYDLQARFNLNNVKEKKSISSLVHLINHIYPKINDKELINLVLGIHEWITPYDLSQGKDAYTTYYLAQNPPYYPSHQFMVSISELRLVKDVSAALYSALEPYITTLPEYTPININTASKQVLMALGNGLSKTQVNEIISARRDNGIKNTQELNELIKKLDLPPDQITLESHYFLSIAQVNNDDLNLLVYTIMKRTKDNNGKLSVSIIRESVNNI